jgi:hypothetical protein
MSQQSPRLRFGGAIGVKHLLSFVDRGELEGPHREFVFQHCIFMHHIDVYIYIYIYTNILHSTLF